MVSQRLAALGFHYSKFEGSVLFASGKGSFELLKQFHVVSVLCSFDSIYACNFIWHVHDV